MADGVDTAQYRCVQCDAAFGGHKRKYCNAACRNEAASRRKGKRPLSEIRARQLASRPICPECKQQFKPHHKDGNSAGAQIYCSRSCYRAEGKRQQSIEYDRLLFARWSKRAKAKLLQVVWGPVSRVLQCACGKFIERGHYVRQCDECRCSNAKDARRKSRRIRKGIERARLRNARVEPVDPVKVFERDGWRCHLCRCKTPARLRGSYDPRAPELDHIIPLAKGGEHSYRNTACACRRCNGAKGDKIIGQMSLLAA